MKILSAPFYTFFSRPFYQEVGRTSPKTGFLYLFYLSVCATGLFALAFCFLFLPQADRFVEWARQEMPVMTIANEALSIDRPSPYSMVHPEFGPVVTFDTTKDEIRFEDMGDVRVFVTRQNIYVRQPNQSRIYPIKNASEGNAQSMQVDAEKVGTFYKKMKPMVILFFTFGVLIWFFVWKSMVSLFYSSIALLFNSMRGTRLAYPQVLNVTIFAMTPTVIFQVLRFFIPILAIRFIFFLDMGLALAYLYFAIKMSETDTGRPFVAPPVS